jgi:hypothetical protein
LSAHFDCVPGRASWATMSLHSNEIASLSLRMMHGCIGCAREPTLRRRVPRG